jgi:hypothetical protein
MRVPRFSVYQLGRGSEPVIVVGSMMSLVPRYIVAISQNAKQDFGFLPAGGIAYRLSANSKKSRRQRPSAHRMRSIGLGDRADGRQAMNSARRRSEDQAPHQRFSSGASLCRALRDRVQY